MSKDKKVVCGAINYAPCRDDDNFVSSSRENYRQRTLSPRERLLPPESPINNTKKRAATKKQSPLSKTKATKKSKTVSTQTDFNLPAVASPQKLCIHEEFPIGSIVGINGYHLDYGKFKVKKHAPLFYGLVEDPSLHQSKEESNEDEVVVKFVVSGEYEWYDRNEPNCLISNYQKNT